jgi:hypothetical protein
MTNPVASDDDGTSSESVRWRYGLLATLAAVFAILAAFVFASLRYSSAGDVSTALAAITGTLGTILGAYLGVQTGSQGKEAAEAARQRAESRAVALAAAADPDRARDALARVEGQSMQPTAAAGTSAPVPRPSRPTVDR